MNNKIILQLRGEIIAAKNFEGKSLFITYCFILPEVWECANENQKHLSGTTVCCKSKKNQENEYVAHFNHLLEFILSVPKDVVNPEHVSMVMEVSSIDWWDRYLCEGYGMVKIPLNSGICNLSIPCWKPTPSTPHGKRCDEMRRFFIGGGCQLNNLGLPLIDTKNESILSRAGLCAESSGMIEINFDVIYQSPIPKTLHLRYVHHKSDALLSSVDEVIKSFLKVQQRMKDLREKLKAEFNI